MKICICTTPIRPVPNDFPPFGSMAIIQSLRKIGEHASFYNIDFFRYKHAEIESYFREHQFDVVGVSAVVSTSYVYTKYLTNLIRSVSPETIIVVGGNLAASAELLLKKCDIDICVIGDGELVVRDLIPTLRNKKIDLNELRKTKGICFLDEEGRFQFTGYGRKPAPDEVEFPDYDILESDGSLYHYMPEPNSRWLFGYEGEIIPGKRVATVIMTKGCVARCTFCHRFERGYRVLPEDRIIEHLKFLIERYNVGYIKVGDENFGADRKAARDLAIRLGELGVPWQVAGVRARTVSKESLQHWKNNGCYQVFFGTESGSPKMLKIMEKNATLEENINALNWTAEADLDTLIQLVIGMPGEDDDTIFETIEFLKTVSTSMKSWKNKAASELISINYAQALPGTPLYEHFRQHGFIKNTLDGEEEYLVQISDTDAYKEDHFINSTGLPMLKVLMWRPIILAHLDAHHYFEQENAPNGLSLMAVVAYYVRLVAFRYTTRLSSWLKKVFTGEGQGVPLVTAYDAENVNDSGYFNIHSGLKYAPLLLNPVTRYCFYPLVATAVTIRTSSSIVQALRLVAEHLKWSMSKNSASRVVPEKSLRKTVEIVPSAHVGHELDNMLPLRKGR